ncbi:hypothetical protein SK128_007591 [Halocaridina rubra]|uniref:Uncharacterized protein n=1 Tax=Halocaridina rubra TaxID=373956 RepID=A0AAN8X256_HALRR
MTADVRAKEIFVGRMQGGSDCSSEKEEGKWVGGGLLGGYMIRRGFHPNTQYSTPISALPLPPPTSTNIARASKINTSFGVRGLAYFRTASSLLN